MPPVLTLTDIALRFGPEPLFRNACLALEPRDRLALVGRNGAGKSTLLRIAAGQIEADSGARFVQPGVRVAYLPQEPDLSAHATAGAYVASALQTDADDYRIVAALDPFGLDPAKATAALSGGEARRAALAAAMAAEPDVLLLDEPTNHLDIAAILALEERLAAWRGALAVVSHDRAFLRRIARGVLWLDRGIVRRMDGGFDGFEAWSEEILTREATEAHKLDRLIAAETAWAVKSITARRTRNEGRLRNLRALRAERRERARATGRAQIGAAVAGSKSALVIEAEGISKSFGGRAVVKPFSTRILKGDKVGVIGPNGAGKTTLLKMFLGQLAPDEGTVRRAEPLAVVYLDQQRATLDPGATLVETLCPGGGDTLLVRGQSKHVIGYLRDFLFRESQARQPVRALSGGERNRLLLARALARPADLLVLDEPTNDLDADTLDLLQETLSDFAGTLLLVSHDRDFLDRVVASTIAFEGEGRVRESPGGYSDWLAQRPAEAAPLSAKAQPAAHAAAPPRAARKLAYRQQRELAQLETEMPRLRTQIAALDAELADPGLYARDATRFSAASAALAAARLALEAAEESWLALELEREALDKG